MLIFFKDNMRWFHIGSRIYNPQHSSLLMPKKGTCNTSRKKVYIKYTHNYIYLPEGLFQSRQSVCIIICGQLTCRELFAEVLGHAFWYNPGNMKKGQKQNEPKLQKMTVLLDNYRSKFKPSFSPHIKLLKHITFILYHIINI